MPTLPSHAYYVIIGAGIHGLSTAMHLAQKLKIRGTPVGERGRRIVVLDKTGVGAGASGIACGVVRNNYFQPAMRELMAHCVSVWETDPEAYSYHAVGYLQISPEVMHAQVGEIYQQQKAIARRWQADEARQRGVRDILGGTVRLQDPGTGETFEASAQDRYYFRVKGADRPTAIGSDTDFKPVRDLDLTRLLKIGTEVPDR